MIIHKIRVFKFSEFVDIFIESTDSGEAQAKAIRKAKRDWDKLGPVKDLGLLAIPIGDEEEIEEGKRTH
jgi:hypothetical protein